MADFWTSITSSYLVFVLFFLAVYWVLTSVFKVKLGKVNFKMALVIILIAGVVFATTFGQALIGSTVPGLSVTQSGQSSSTNVNGKTCQQPGGGNTNSVLVNAKNGLNLNQDYMTATAVLIYDDGGESASSALTGGTKTYTTFNSAPCKTGNIYLLSSTTSNGQKVPFDSYSLTKNYDIVGSNSTRVGIDIFNSAFTAISASGGGYALNTTEQTIGAGGTLTGYLDFKPNQTIGQYGSDDGGVLFAVDSKNTAKISKQGVTLTSSNIPLTKIDCGSVANLAGAYSADVCYKAPALKSTGGPVRVQYNIQADIADPVKTATDSDAVVIYVEDFNYARDTDGTVKMLVKDGASADIGQSASNVQINVA